MAPKARGVAAFQTVPSEVLFGVPVWPGLGSDACGGSMQIAINAFNGILGRLGLPPGRLGNVVFVPGILGSDLTDGNGQHVWLVPPLFEQLLLAPDGTAEAAPGRIIQPTVPSPVFYLPLLQALELSWNVLPFAYDWRRDIPQTAELLAAAVRNRFGDEDFHIVAHSMGGLIARVMLHVHPGIQGDGKLVMLGTPNHGSVLALQILTSPEHAAYFFGLFGVDAPPPVPVEAAQTWPSCYQLLPCPSHDPASQPIYANPPAGLLRQHVQAAAALHAALDAIPGTDAMFYVAGSDVPTLDGGSLPTLEGDGVVSHRLGFLDGVQTFKLFATNHVVLPSHPLVLASITPLLHDGNPALLTAE